MSTSSVIFPYIPANLSNKNGGSKQWCVEKISSYLQKHFVQQICQTRTAVYKTMVYIKSAHICLNFQQCCPLSGISLLYKPQMPNIQVYERLIFIDQFIYLIKPFSEFFTVCDYIQEYSCIWDWSQPPPHKWPAAREGGKPICFAIFACFACWFSLSPYRKNPVFVLERHQGIKF